MVLFEESLLRIGGGELLIWTISENLKIYLNLKWDRYFVLKIVCSTDLCLL